MLCRRHVEVSVPIPHAAFLTEWVLQPTGVGRLLAQSTKPEDEEGAHSQVRGGGLRRSEYAGQEAKEAGEASKCKEKEGRESVEHAISR